MGIPYPDLMDMRSTGDDCSYTDREVMLYALGIGMGEDPLGEKELEFVNEGWLTGRDPTLKVVPTFASTFGYFSRPPAIPVDRVKVVDAARDILFHKPLPIAAKLTADSTYTGAWDKGDKGAIIQRESVVTDESGEKICTIRGMSFARGDGHFGGPADGAPEAHQAPDRAPDLSVDIPTRDGQALLFRLAGDRNPLHSDPEFGRKAGFDKPILHGMCTYGITCRAVLSTFADWDPTAFRRHAAQFRSPVYPGETITVHMWRDGGTISFEAEVKDRGVTVVKHGLTELG